MPARRRTDPVAGGAAVERALAALDAGQDPQRADLRTATRFLLEELAQRAPGNSVEVRVPPFGVTQAVPGPRHTRGTPAAVVETDPRTWLELAAGRVAWSEVARAGRLVASGERTDLGSLMPLV